MSSENHALPALVCVVALSALLAGCGTGNPAVDQYSGSTGTSPTGTGTSPTGTNTSPTGTNTSPTGTNTSQTGTSGTTTGATTGETPRTKPPRTKITVRVTTRKKGRKGRKGRNARGLANARVKGRRAKIRFEADPPDKGGTFECRIDGGAFKPCRSPYRSGKLKPGKHTFEVRAINADGVGDKTPAKDRFRITRGK